jgi:predicted negative regulator of RcsB-dependent stress response
MTQQEQQTQNPQQQQQQFQQIYDENMARVNAIITTLADAPHSGEKQTALHQLRDLQQAMRQQQDQLSVAA